MNRRSKVCIVFVMITLFLAGCHSEVNPYVFDPPPFIGLNLLLSVVAALQGSILLISAKRADELVAKLAGQDAAVNLESERRIEMLQIAIARLETAKHNEILAEIAELRTILEDHHP